MSNRTAIILIPPLCANTEDLVEYCNEFLKKEYTLDRGWDSPCLFEVKETPSVPDILVGEFPYLNEAGFIGHLKGWFHPEPIYKVADETEKPTRYFSQAYVQVNSRWGAIQLIMRREHDCQFWFANITKDGVKPFGHIGVNNQ